MAHPPPSRRSGRRRVPTQKYTNNVFESLEIFRSESEEELQVLERLQTAENDEDYPEDQVADEPEYDDSLVENASDGSAVLTPIEDYEDAHSYASTDGEEPLSLGAAKSKARSQAAYREANIHTRGLPDNPFRQDGQRSRLRLFAGEGKQDISHVLRLRDQWAPDATLPQRRNLAQLFPYFQETRQIEATTGWDWYYDQGGREYFFEQQKMKSLNADEAAKYIPKSNMSGHPLLMGPYGSQMIVTLLPLQTINLNAAWVPAPGARDGSYESKQQARSGWILNIGSRIKCLDWAPNQDGDTQYLAIAMTSLHDATYEQPFTEAPSYTPCSSTLSAIQIWAFAAKDEKHTGSSIELDKAPELRLVIVSDWGDIKSIKWCPVPRASRDHGVHSYPSTSLGLLAGVWADGFVRVSFSPDTSFSAEIHPQDLTCSQVLDIQLKETETNITQKCESAAFAACPAETLSTCVTWLSPVDLAVGHANGLLTIYDIYPRPNSNQRMSGHHSDPGKTRPQDSAIDMNPTPWLAVPLHSTYIVSLTTAYPTHPTLLVSSSLSGYLRLTSLVAPNTDFVYSVRTRTPPMAIAYYDPLLSVVGVEECSETVRVWALRCFYASLGFGRMTSPPGPGSGVIDAGRCHGSVAIGGTDGGVIVTNPVRKTLGRTEKGYQQCIFKHEWVRRPKQSGDVEAGKREGMTRVTESYKGEAADVDVHRKKKPSHRSNVMMTTTYEQETAVTALRWNPNVKCGGWLAVGWGSGLVRVQDVAL